ncbi:MULTISPECIES: Sjogren's syndrome/scleroderma autoantigen 1 family protein [Halobacterium]|uniref:UPF0148 protein APQ99_00735 n=1 Tax=Halobacterium salinarum (strain ATCC 33171 / DSM 3754 / JCM 8978 / NBRC 102687 / NCIMB 764 / 91-R6) TaxID=2597657 RepID=A0A4D6GVR4_HALS9|nr:MULTISPECIES: Sjogren's syndrome/scleroderma autoantigen 1 family protein [Halobacterium]MDL0121980.1 Sjogren's syndrome/scleroderma autoantigen 1 family protein [Halobacterium salinarum]MDL0124238.1 Sjogren's syndrome/scleroderma autoantigen 1 family protein [Halobacterium salinarum]MDL0127124.1 Sjogren's syndrome/scleroderma autoantigen 1 family protein [Halobacterium salinarum]MDL0132939.1 Sjogren's syndrome/scleroderma autoantigen 1 family protein [Halobacterium salinarum]MDL0135482.1 S
MSNTDDGFDKEAAREELREKYNADQQDREETARMSDLLLQGATMTNDHCDRCGTPLFRHDGETFCPTCQHDDNDDEPTATTQSAPDRSPPADPQATPPSSPPTTPDTSSSTAAATDDVPTAAARDRPEHAPTAEPTTPATEELESTIAALARRASDADDPRTAREYLEAAHEAAAALDTLRP